MNLEAIGRITLFADLVAGSCLVVFAWLDLRRQTTDVGRVGGVVALAALSFVLYLVGRSYLTI